MDEDDELTLPEVATMLGLNISTPRSWVSAGRLPAHKDEANQREDWSDAPEQATLDLTSSLELPGVRR